MIPRDSPDDPDASPSISDLNPAFERWPLYMRIFARLPQVAAELNVSDFGDGDGGDTPDAVDDVIDGSLGAVLRNLFNIARTPSIDASLAAQIDVDQMTDEGRLANTLFACLLAEKTEQASNDIGVRAAIRSYRSLASYKTRHPVDFHWEAAHAFLKRWGAEHECPEIGDDNEAGRLLGHAFPDPTG